MQTMYRLGMVFAFASALAFAETWTGRLVDAASCDVQQQRSSSQQQPSDMPDREDGSTMTSSCSPTASTTTFGLMTDDQKIYKFDSEGNRKAAQAFKQSESGAERSSDPNSQRPVEHTATVKGTLRENEIAVDSIEVH